MFTQEEIAKLAREYAEEAAKGIELPNCLNQEAVNMLAEDMAHKISWLLRTHCIVSKEKVRNCYNMAKSNIKTQYLEACQFEVGATKVLESLFDAETFKNSSE